MTKGRFIFIALMCALETFYLNDCVFEGDYLFAFFWKLFFTIPEKDLIKVYKEKSLVLNKQVTFMENDQLFSGVATDVTNQGHLLVTLDNGQEKLLRSGEISLSSWQ